MTTITEGLHNYTHKKGYETTDTRIINVVNNGNTTKYKFTYRCYNAGEQFNGEVFDGKQLNFVFGLNDLGQTRDSSAYHILSEVQLKARIEMLNVLGKKFVESLY